VKKNSYSEVTKTNIELYLLFLLPTLVYFIIFRYLPMVGAQIAFRNYLPSRGFWASPWVGLKHFKRFFNSYQFTIVLKNTIGLSFYQLLVGFPFPIILSLMLHQVQNAKFKKLTQTVTYAPHFISIVVLVGMLHVFLNPRTGLINLLIMNMGGEMIFFMGKADLFKTIYVFSGVWQNVGWGMIIYLASLSSISPSLYEAASIDGASRFQKIIHIDIPGIIKTIIVLLILNTGKVMSLGFEKAFLMQNSLNLGASEVISTYVYKIGLISAQFSFASAVGLFNGIVNLILLLTVNQISKKVSSIGLF
jgi:putative aldouronate transport system permease protein